jgi:geranylgeranyl diphosphate synthase, type I
VRRLRRPLTADRLSRALGVADDLRRLRGHLTVWIEQSEREIREPLRWQLVSSPKYFRPLTVFACCRSVSAGIVPTAVMRSAVALELFHNVSLIVDDILDRSRFRRGRLTLHCRFGELRAWMTAGYLTAGGFAMVAGDDYATRLLAELLQRLGVAECVQWRLRRRPLTVADWRAIAGEDTGSMFEVCARLGTRDSRLRRYGRLLGILYHGCDDVADARGAAALGGGGDEDLRDGILTLPAAFALRDPRVAEIFRAPLNGNAGRLRKKLAEVLPKAERYLDDLAADAIREALGHADQPAALVTLVRHTRALSAG